MISREEISSKAKKKVIYLLTNLMDFRKEFVEICDECISEIKVVRPLSLLNSINAIKDKGTAPKETITKTFEPNMHIYTRRLKFPENRNLYLEYLKNIPNGYGVLETVDDSGYCIDDLDTYEGIIKLTFYNKTFVEVEGVYNPENGEYMFDNSGVGLTVYSYNPYKKL